MTTLLEDGTYTPTYTDILNATTITAYSTAYYRVGNKVTVFGRVDIDPTTATAVSFLMTLPIASNIGGFGDLAGSFVNINAAPITGSIVGDSGGDGASIQFTPTTAAAQVWQFNFSYKVI